MPRPTRIVGKRGRSPQRLGSLLAPVTLWVGLFIVVPLALVVLYAFTRQQGLDLGAGGWSADHPSRVIAGEPIYRIIMWRSFVLGAMATGITLAVAYFPACYLAQASSRIQRWLVLLLVIPFWTPYIIRIFSWLLILSDHGVLATALRGVGFDVSEGFLYSRWAVLAGLVYSGVPFMLLPIYASVSRTSAAVYEAAANLGARDWARFREITVPLSLPGVWVGCLIVFILSAGSYLAPAILGGPNETMIAQVILDRFLVSLDWPLGAAISVLYLAVSLLILGAVHVLVSRHPAFQLQPPGGTT
jgi:spermidine/putrescine transport system permease protein